MAAPSGCSDGHIHFSLRKVGTEDYIDPSRYMERREVPRPQWVQECDKYLLVWKVGDISLLLSYNVNIHCVRQKSINRLEVVRALRGTASAICQ